MTAICLKTMALYETRAGNLAHAVGRLAFKPGRPMLIEHAGGLFLEHALTGRVITAGYPDDFDITCVIYEETSAVSVQLRAVGGEDSH